MFLLFLISQVLEAQLIQLSNTQLVNQIQTKQNVTYYFQPYTQDAKNYIFIEQRTFYYRLRIQNYKDGQAQLLLTCSFNSITTYEQNGSTVQVSANYSDWNAYTNNKTYHNLLIPPYNSYYLWNDTYFITIFIPQSTTYNYSLTISRSSTPPCPNNCNNYDDSCKSGFCDCQSTFLDLDCSKSGIPLLYNNKMDNILVSGYKYFYFEVTNTQSSLTISIQLSDASPQIFYSVVAYIMVEDFVYGVPNSQYYIQKDSISQQRKKITFIVDTKQITYITSFLRYQRILITVYSPQSAILLFQVQSTSSEGSFDTNLLLIYFLVSLAVVLLLTWIIITLIRYKQAQNSRVHDVAVVNRRRQPQQQQLNMQLIEKYMPKYQYFLIFETLQFKKKHVTKSTNESCSVCLLEFDDYTECRFCPCLHIFHSECLSQWLLKHENCPNCRLELNEKELIKHEMEWKYQQDQDQRSTQLNSIDKLQSTKKVRLQRPSNFLGQQDQELL